jgi:hypothetical protein
MANQTSIESRIWIKIIQEIPISQWLSRKVCDRLRHKSLQFNKIQERRYRALHNGLQQSWLGFWSIL